MQAADGAPDAASASGHDAPPRSFDGEVAAEPRHEAHQEPSFVEHEVRAPEPVERAPVVEDWSPPPAPQTYREEPREPAPQSDSAPAPSNNDERPGG